MDTAYPIGATCPDEMPYVPPTYNEHESLDHEAGHDPRANNNLRARWAGEALRAYGKVTGTRQEPLYAAISDLLTDLRHLVDAVDTSEEPDGEQQTFDELVARTETRYLEEIHGEG